MTLSAFDPMCLERYPADNPPLMFHFQHDGSEDVFRYVLVERIPINEINPATRRKQSEPLDEKEVVKKYGTEKSTKDETVGEDG